MLDGIGDPYFRELERELAAPFPHGFVDWRVKIKPRNPQDGKGDAMCLAYLDARAVQHRFDEVCGIAGWQCKHRDGGDGRLTCSIGVFVNGEWVWKSDGAGDRQASQGLSEQDANKGDYSDAFKRAAVAWGVGRYLYNLGNTWLPAKQRGQSWFIDHDDSTTANKIRQALLSVEESPIGLNTPGERNLASVLVQTVHHFCQSSADVDEFIEKNRGTLEKLTEGQKAEVWKAMSHIKEKETA